jgi:serine/threonine-protein kinase
VVVLAAAVVAGLLVARSEGLFTPSKPVPTLVGQTVAQAHQLLTAGQFKLQERPPAYSTTVQAGFIISQSPAPKTSLKQGSTVHVVASKGPPSVQVPSLDNVDCSVAGRLLAEAHLKANCPALQAYSTSVKSGIVINWSYNNEINPTTAPYGATILVAVSQGPPPVAIPSNLAGGTFANAQTTLVQLGFSVTMAQENSTQYPSGQVTRTNPPGGSMAQPGTGITVYVSQGPPIVTIPDVTHDSVAQATAALQAAGLAVGQVYGPQNGKVFTTNPLAGQQLQQGQSVNLYTQ